jgi:hypothetical protein
MSNLSTRTVEQADIEPVVTDIISGKHDLNLDAIVRAVHLRNEQIAQARVLTLRVGDRVVIQGAGMGSKYLNGMPATVIGFATKNIKVKIDANYDTRRYGHILRVPPSMIRRLEVE